MAAPTVITITNAFLRLGEDEASVTPPGTGAEDFSCQVTSAAINATPNLNDVPATFCAPASQSPAATGFELGLTWLQDWTATGGGLSMYAFDNDTLTKWFSLSLDDTAAPIAIGQVRVVAGSYGGDAGTPLTTDVVWPVVGKPDITPAAVLAARQAEQVEPEPAEVA